MSNDGRSGTSKEHSFRDDLLTRGTNSSLIFHGRKLRGRGKLKGGRFELETARERNLPCFFLRCLDAARRGIGVRQKEPDG